MSSSFHWCQAMFPFRHGTYCGSFPVQCQTFAAQDCFRHHGGSGGARGQKTLRASLPPFAPCFAPQAMARGMNGAVWGQTPSSAGFPHRILTGFTGFTGLCRVEMPHGFAPSGDRHPTRGDRHLLRRSLVSGSYLRLHPSGFGSFITWLVRSCQTPLKHVEVSSKVLFQKNGDVGKAC